MWEVAFDGAAVGWLISAWLWSRQPSGVSFMEIWTIEHERTTIQKQQTSILHLTKKRTVLLLNLW